MKKDIYISTRATSSYDSDSNEIATYNTPILYSMNVQPISGSIDVREYGERTKQIQRAIVSYETYFGLFKEGDLAYLDGVVPTGEGVNGDNANYRIDSVRNQNKRIAIFFERITGK